MSSMNILKEITKDFKYEENLVNSEIRKLISGNFRGLLVNKNGFCYCGSNTKTMKLLTKRGYYGSTTEDKTWIKPWRLTALVWHDQTPSLHLIDSEKDKDKYLNLLAFIKVLEKYPDEYELLMNELKTDYYPLSRGKIFNVVTGVIGVSTHNFKIKHPFEYERINWYFFEEIGEKIEFDFYNFKDELSKELDKNLKSESPKVTEDKEEEEPEEELEVCLSDSKLDGAPSLRPKVKEEHSQSDIYYSGNNIPEETRKMEENYSEKEEKINKLIKKLIEASEKRDGAGTFHLISELRRMGLTEKEIGDRSASALGIFPPPSSINKVEYDPSKLMEAQDSSVLEENELRGYRDCTSSPNVAQKDKIKSGKDQTTDQKKVLLEQLLEACKNRDYARSACLQNELIYMGVSMEEIRTKCNEMVGGKDTETEEDKTDVSSSSGSIEELQELFDRRAKLKKELAEIEEKIKASIFH